MVSVVTIGFQLVLSGDYVWSLVEGPVQVMNEYHLKVVKIQGEFVWHDHKDTDEVFIVLEGAMRIDFRDGEVILRTGEMFVVPKGMEHKPFAAEECKILLIEPVGLVNTGDASGE